MRRGSLLRLPSLCSSIYRGREEEAGALGFPLGWGGSHKGGLAPKLGGAAATSRLAHLLGRMGLRWEGCPPLG